MTNQPFNDFTKETITSMVESSTTQNLSIWAMVVILSVFLSAMVVIIKVFMNSSVKTNEGLKMVIQQSAEQLHIFRESIDKITENFRFLSESIAKLQVFKIGEEDKFDKLILNLNDLKHDILDVNANIFKTIIDHDRSVHEFYLSGEKNMEKFKASLLEMKAFCRVPSENRKRLGDILVEDGICTREQINQAIKKQTLMELDEDKNL
ncbi:MAG: hypothetical protein ACOYWZ_16790 [Bacillota bacterium]